MHQTTLLWTIHLSVTSNFHFTGVRYFKEGDTLSFTYSSHTDDTLITNGVTIMYRDVDSSSVSIFNGGHDYTVYAGYT